MSRVNSANAQIIHVMNQGDDSKITSRTHLSPGPRQPGQRTACVIVIHGEGLGKRADIDSKPLLVGRSRETDLHIPHQSVSRRHCEIWRTHDGYRIRDLGATNVTRLNGTPLSAEEVVLNDGDQITIGESILKFISHASVEAMYHEEVYQLATHDPLTDLYNRRHFSELLEKEIARARRHQRPLALCILDVDLFKPVNDRFGHIEGDKVLRGIAMQIRKHVRTEDVAARIGGEEFAVLVPEGNLDAARAFAERLRSAVEQTPFQLGAGESHVTISIGIAALNEDRNHPTALMQAADAALYRAKDAGRNQVCVAAP